MPIKNITKNKIIAADFKLCEDLSKFIGLMLSKNSNKTLIFKFNKEKIISLHMLFVFYPIDVLFLDKNKVVVEIKERFMPFAFYTPKRKAQYIIEIPVKTIKKTKTKLGDKISF